MKRLTLLLIVAGLALLLSACAALMPTPTPTPALPTETPAPPTAAPENPPTPIPTEAPRSYSGYRHPSGVFALNIPDDWDLIDESGPQRLLLRLLPPQGYGSRVLIEATYEGPQTPDQTRALLDESLAPLLAGGYHEISRTDLPDGRTEIMLDYQDGRGGRGLERLIAGAYGPYFVLARYFLAASDEYTLRQALEAMASSFSVDPLAGWGSAVAAINPAELLIVNTLLWVDDDRVIHYTGELYNAAPATIVEASLRIGFCDRSGVVIAEVNQPPAVSRVTSGQRVPFGVTLSGLPEAAQVCTASASALPEPANPVISTALLITPGLVQPDEDQLAVTGTISNPELATLSQIVVSVAAYDAEGRIVGFGSLSYGDELQLAPGDRHDFQLTLQGLQGEAVRYLILAQGRKG